MKSKTIGGVLVIVTLALLVPLQGHAYQNFLVNSDFSQPLSTGWSTSTNVFWESFYDPFYSPSGDNSAFARLMSNTTKLSPRLSQTVDLPDWEQVWFSADVIIATYEEQGNWPGNDVSRAQIEAKPPEYGWQEIFGVGSGSGVFSFYDEVNYPGLRYYTMTGFTYDLSAYRGTQGFQLSFVIDGRGQQDSYMLVDNARIEAIPEPATLLLTSLGLGMIGMRKLRRRRAK